MATPLMARWIPRWISSVWSPPRTFTIETGIEHIADDELVEVTPDAVRVRKRILAEHERRRSAKRPRNEDD